MNVLCPRQGQFSIHILPQSVPAFDSWNSPHSCLTFIGGQALAVSGRYAWRSFTQTVCQGKSYSFTKRCNVIYLGSVPTDPSFTFFLSLIIWLVLTELYFNHWEQPCHIRIDAGDAQKYVPALPLMKHLIQVHNEKYCKRCWASHIIEGSSCWSGRNTVIGSPAVCATCWARIIYAIAPQQCPLCQAPRKVSGRMPIDGRLR